MPGRRGRVLVIMAIARIPRRWLAVVALLAAGTFGCVERRLTITTVPTDAEIFLDGRRVGMSPVTVPFAFYGTREIVARKVGYLPERHRETLVAPYFQESPYDLYYEAMTRDQYLDHRDYNYVLTPVGEQDTARARVLEKRAEAGELRAR